MRTYRDRITRLLLCLILLLAAAAFPAGQGYADSPQPSINASGIPNLPLSVDLIGRNEGYSAVLYNNTNGLPTSEANAITETSEGFIWIGSYSGLIRYDGNSFVRLDSTTGIASVISLYADGQNRLWIGTNDAGLAVMDRGELRRWGEAEGLKSLRISSIVEDEQGRVYAATVLGVAVIDTDMQLHHLSDPRISDAFIETMRIGNDGLIYGVTNAGDLFTLRNGELLSFLSQEESGLEDVSCVLPDPCSPGAVFLGTDGSTVYYGTLDGGAEGMKARDISPLSSVSCMEYIDGQLWL